MVYTPPRNRARGLVQASSITPPLRGSRREGGARSRAGGGQTRRPVSGDRQPSVEIFSPSPNPGNPLSIHLRRLSAPSWTFVPLRGNLLTPVTIPLRTPFVEIPSPPSRFTSEPSVDIFSPFCPSRTLATPFRSTPNAFVPLRGNLLTPVTIPLGPPSWKSFSLFPLPNPGNPLPIHPQRLRAPSWKSFNPRHDSPPIPPRPSWIRLVEIFLPLTKTPASGCIL